MTTAITEYQITEAKLQELREKFSCDVWVVDTPDRMKAAKDARGEIRRWRLDLESERKRIKAPALQRCKEIDSEAKRITGELLKLETPIADAIKEVEDKKKREEEAAKQAEEQRINRCRTEIENIRQIPISYVGQDSETIEKAIDSTHALDLSQMKEFEGVAQKARNETIEKLNQLLKDAIDREKEKDRLEAERIELAKRKAEQEAQEEAERKKREEEERARRAKLEAEEKEARERIAQQEREAREARERADREAREERAKQEAIALEEKKKADALRVQREVEEREKQRKRAQILSARDLLKTFVERYGEVEEFASVVKAIRGYFDE